MAEKMGDLTRALLEETKHEDRLRMRSGDRRPTDFLPHKASFIPDQDLHPVFDSLDQEIVDRLASGELSKDEAYWNLRMIINKASRSMYQCRECGRLYLDDRSRTLHSYLPADEATQREILRSRDD